MINIVESHLPFTGVFAIFFAEVLTGVLRTIDCLRAEAKAERFYFLTGEGDRLRLLRSAHIYSSLSSWNLLLIFSMPWSSEFIILISEFILAPTASPNAARISSSAGF